MHSANLYMYLQNARYLCSGTGMHCAVYILHCMGPRQQRLFACYPLCVGPRVPANRGEVRKWISGAHPPQRGKKRLNKEDKRASQGLEQRPERNTSASGRSLHSLSSERWAFRAFPVIFRWNLYRYVTLIYLSVNLTCISWMLMHY